MTNNMVGRPIVAGVDGSPSALHAAVWAADEAAFRGMPLRLVHCVNVSAVRYFGDVEARESEGRRHLAAAEAVVRTAYPEVDVEVGLENADPVSALVALSRHAHLDD